MPEEPRRTLSVGERSIADQPSPANSRPMTGCVKWYNYPKGFGFVAVDGGGKDIFVHATTLERSGLADLSEGQRVSLQVVERPKGLEAVRIALAS